MTESRSTFVQTREPSLGPRALQPGPRPNGAVGMLNVILRHRFLVLSVMLLLPAIVLGTVLLRPGLYTSSAAVVPQARRLPSNLGGLAAQFGVALPGAEASQSPAFYAELVRSRSILESVATASYSVGNHKGPLYSFVLTDTAGKPTRVLTEETLDWLREEISAAASQRTGVVSMSLSSKSPALATQVLQHVLAELERYNVATRRSQARAEREFTEQRLSMARAELRVVEERMTGFESSNRLQQAPYVRTERERLQRELGFREQVVNSLVQAYEQARIDEVRDTPVFSILDAPSQPARPDKRGLGAKLLSALFVGLAFGILLAFARNMLSMRGNSVTMDEVTEFELLRNACAQDLRHPIRGIKRALRGNHRETSTLPA